MNFSEASSAGSSQNISSTPKVTTTFVVDSPDDTPDSLPGDGLALDSNGKTSLRAAIMEANSGTGGVEIVLPAATYQLSRSGTLEDLAATGDLDIAVDLTISGAGAQTTLIDGASLDRVFHVFAGVSFQLQGVALIGGHPGTEGTALERSGGALFNEGETTLIAVAARLNTSDEQGGAFFNLGTLYLSNSTLESNTAHDGGALANGAAGITNVGNTTISGNTAAVAGGGIFNAGQLSGAHLTITDNAAAYGGGCYSHVTAATGLVNSLVAANQADINPDVEGAFTSNGGNLIGDSGDALGFVHGQNGDLVGNETTPMDPLIDALADNGGETRSHWLNPGSPAIDAGMPNGASAEDQRGIVRPQDADGDGAAAHDIGSVELVRGYTLISPNGGERLRQYEAFPVTWRTTGVTGSIDLDVSYDDGAGWESIVSARPDDGLFEWTPQTTSDAAIMRISNAADGSILAVGSFSVPEPTLTLTSPNGGETLLPGQVISITWDQEEMTGDVDLSLSRDNGTTWESLVRNFAGTGFDWTVAGAPANQALIRINSNAVPGLKDFSDAPFSIAEPVLRITSPNGGETLIPGSTHIITWEAADFVGDMDLKLSLDGGTSWQTIVNNTTVGAYAWQVPNQPSTNAVIRIYANGVAQLKDTSDGPFTIATPHLALTSHNGGETLYQGQTVTISWAADNVPGDVDLSLSRDNGAGWESLVDFYTGTSFDWTVTGAVTDQAVLRLTSNQVPGLKDFSDTVFSIAAPQLNLTSPNGGEILTPGQVHTITWNPLNLAGTVNLKLSLDAGATWQTIATEVTGSSFDWTVPNQPSGNAVVHIYSNAAPVSDSSDAVFAVATPDFRITRPNGGETLFPGSVYAITWNQENVPGDVDLSLSRDNGATWESLVDNFTGNFFEWTVTGNPTNQAVLRLNSNSVTGLKDFSDAPFNIGAFETESNPEGDDLDRDINPFNSDSDNLGLVDKAPFVRVNEYTGKVTANLDPIGVSGLVVQPSYKLPGRPGPGFEAFLENRGALGVGWHLGYGLLIVEEGEKFTENWETVKHVDGSGNITPFYRDYLFQDFPGKNPRELGGSGDRYYPDQHYTPPIGLAYNRTRIRDMHFIDENLRRLTRETPGDNPDEETRYYHLMDFSGRKIKYAPAIVPNPGPNDPRPFVPVLITEPNGRTILIEYEDGFGFGTPSGTEVGSIYIKRIKDHDRARTLRFHYEERDGDNKVVNSSDANEPRRYVTAIELEGAAGMEAVFAYQDEAGDFSGDDLHLKSVVGRGGYHTDIALDMGALPNQGFPYLQSITAATGGEVFLDYDTVAIDVNVAGRCRLNGRPNPGDDGGNSDCEPVVGPRPHLNRVVLLRHSGGEYHYTYQQIKNNDSVAYYEDGGFFDTGEWDPFKVTVEEVNGVSSGDIWVRETYYAMEPQDLNTLSSVSPVVGQPLVRTESWTDGGIVSSKREEWRYAPLSTERGVLRIGGTRKQGYVALPIKTADHRIKKDGQWIGTDFTYQWVVTPNLDENFFLQPKRTDRFYLGADGLPTNISLSRIFDFDNSRLNRVNTYLTGTDVTYDKPFQPALRVSSEEFLYPNGLGGDDQLLGKVTVAYHPTMPLPVCKRVFTSEAESINTAYQYYNDGGPNQGMPQYQARGLICGTPLQDSPFKTTFLDYQFGAATRVIPPDGPEHTKVLNPDGTVAEETANGVTTVYNYDLERRVIETSSGVGSGPSFTRSAHPIHTIFDEPDANGRGKRFMISYQAESPNSWPRLQWGKEIYDDWGRVVEKRTALTTATPTTDPDLLDCSSGGDLPTSGNIIACEQMVYAPIGVVSYSRNARGTTTTTTVDIFGRPLVEELKDADENTVSFTTFDYQLDMLGGQRVTQTISRTESGDQVIKHTVKDLLGRVVETGLTQPGYPTNATEFAYTHELLNNQWVWKTTIKPYGNPQRYSWTNLLGQLLQESHPEEDEIPGTGATAVYTYDARGLMVQNRKNARLYETRYDNAGRRTQWGLPGSTFTELQSFEYDPDNGQLSRSSNFSGVVTETRFDPFHRPETMVLNVPMPDQGPNPAGLLPRGVQMVEPGTSLGDMELHWPGVTDIDTYQVEFLANGAPIWSAYAVVGTTVVLPLSTDPALAVVTTGESYQWRVRGLYDHDEPTLWTTTTLSFSEAPPTGPALSVVPIDQLNFNQGLVGVTKTLSLSVTNPGQQDLVGTVRVVNEEGEAFALLSGPDILIAPGSGIVQEMSIGFNPNQAGTFIGRVEFDTNGGQLDVPLTGEGVIYLPPRLAASRSSLDFGEQTPDVDYFQTFQITNFGGETLEGSISVVNTANAGFSLETPAQISLAPAAEMSITVKFHPNHGGSFSGYLRLSTNDPEGDLDITLAGSGVGLAAQIAVPPANLALDFGTVVAGESASIVGEGVRIYNRGQDPNSVIELSESNFHFASGTAFRLDPYNGDQLPCTVPHVTTPGKNSCWFRIRFDAPLGEAGTFTDTLTIDPGEGNGEPVEISLIGKTEAHLTLLTMADDANNTPIYDYMWDRYYYNVPAVTEKQFRITNLHNEQVAVHIRTKWPFVTCLEPNCGNQHTGYVLDPGKSAVFSIFADPAENDGEDAYAELMNIQVLRTTNQALLQERNVPLALIPEVPEFEDFFSILDRSPSFPRGYLGRKAEKEITVIWNAHDITLADEIRMVYEGDMAGAYPTILTYDPSSLKHRNVPLHFPINELGALNGAVRYEAYLNGSFLVAKTIEYTTTGFEHFRILSVPDGNFQDGQVKFFTMKNDSTINELDIHLTLPPHFLARIKKDDVPDPFQRNLLEINFPPNNGVNTQKVIEVLFDPTHGGTFAGLVAFQPTQGSQTLPGTIELPVIAESNQPLGSELKFRAPDNVFRDDPVLEVGGVFQGTTSTQTVEIKNFGVTTKTVTFEVALGARDRLSIQPSGLTVAPGETQTAEVTFSPPADAYTGRLYGPHYSLSALIDGQSAATLQLAGEIVEQAQAVRFMNPVLGEFRNEFVIDIRDLAPGESRTVNLTYQNNDPAGLPWTLHQAAHTTFGSGQSAQASLLHTGYGTGVVSIHISLPPDYDTTDPNVDHFSLVSYGGAERVAGTLLYPFTMPIARSTVSAPESASQTGVTSGDRTLNLSYEVGSGRLESITSPLGNRQVYTYAAGGGITQVSYDNQLIQTPFFQVTHLDPDGAVTRQEYLADLGNQAATGTFGYDALGRPRALALANGTTHHYNAFDIDYDEWGYVQGYKRDDVFLDDFDIAYTYTSQGQLAGFAVTDTRDGATQTVNYEYDGGTAQNFGNLTARGALSIDLDRDAATTDDLLVLPELAAGSVVYDSKNRIDDPDWDYDGEGRLLADDTNRYAYDVAGRLVLVTRKVSGTTRGPLVGHYLYDAAGNRVRTLTDDTLTYSSRNGGVVAETCERLDDGVVTTKEHILLSGKEIMMVSTTDDVSLFEFQFSDRLGNPAVRWSGTDFKYQEYAPYGHQMWASDRHTGAYGFTGHEDDGEGLTYMNARFFGAELGRFTKPDPARAFNPLKPFSHNLYLYGSANPVNFTDPTGLGEKAVTETIDEEPHTCSEECLYLEYNVGFKIFVSVQLEFIGHSDGQVEELFRVVPALEASLDTVITLNLVDERAPNGKPKKEGIEFGGGPVSMQMGHRGEGAGYETAGEGGGAQRALGFDAKIITPAKLTGLQNKAGVKLGGEIDHSVGTSTFGIGVSLEIQLGMRSDGSGGPTPPELLPIRYDTVW